MNKQILELWQKANMKEIPVEVFEEETGINFTHFYTVNKREIMAHIKSKKDAGSLKKKVKRSILSAVKKFLSL